MLLKVFVGIEAVGNGLRDVYEERDCVALKAIRYEGNDDAVIHFSAKSAEGKWHKVRKADNKRAKLPTAGSDKMPWAGRSLINGSRMSRPVWRYETVEVPL